MPPPMADSSRRLPWSGRQPGGLPPTPTPTQTNVSANPSSGTPPASRTSRARRIARSPVMPRWWTSTAASTERWRTAALKPVNSGPPSTRIEVELAAEPGEGAGPGGRGQEVAGPGDGRADRQDGQVIVGGVDQGVGQGLAALDHVVQPHLGPEAQQPREHRTGQVGVDQHGAAGVARQGAGQGQDEGRAALGAMATGEEDGPEVLAAPALDEPLGEPLEPVAPVALQGEDDGRPLQLGHRPADGASIPRARAGADGRRGRRWLVRRRAGTTWAGQWGAGGTPWGGSPLLALGIGPWPGPRQLPSCAGSSQTVVGQHVSGEDHGDLRVGDGGVEGGPGREGVGLRSATAVGDVREPPGASPRGPAGVPSAAGELGGPQQAAAIRGRRGSSSPW